MMWLLKRSNYDIWFRLLVSRNRGRKDPTGRSKSIRAGNTRYHRPKNRKHHEPALSVFFLNYAHDKELEVQ